MLYKEDKMNLKVYKIRPEAKLPVRAHPTDAGMDLFYCPYGGKKLYDFTETYYIPPRESRVLPTGIKVEVPYGHMLEIKNKSTYDGRGYIVTLSYKGEKIMSRLEKQMEETLDQFIDEIDTPSKQTLIDLLENLNWKASCYIHEL